MSLRFQDPLLLVLIAAALPMAVAGWLWFRAMTRSRRWVCIALRVLVFAALAAALAGATLVQRIDRLNVIALIDISGSVRRLFDPQVDVRVGQFLDQASRSTDRSAARRPDDLSTVIAYADQVAVIGPPEPRWDAPFIPAPMLEESAPAGATDTASAIRTAAAIAPPDSIPRIVLFTDGNDTAGDALRAAEALRRGLARPPGVEASGSASGDEARRSSIPIDIAPLVYSAPREIEVESIETPSLAPGESTVYVRITLLATEPTSGELRLSREGESVDASPPPDDQPGLGRRLSLPAGRTNLRIPVRLPSGRVHRFAARFVPDDPAADRIAENNSAESVTLTPGRSSVLIIDGITSENAGSVQAAARAGTLEATLADSGLEVESRSPSSITTDPLFLQRFDLVVLQNVAADALNEGVAEALASYVTEQGGGLVMVGGPDSFGAGGWKGTPIEPILPVRLDLPERLVSPAAAVVIVIDCSGSMGFRMSGGPLGTPRRSKQAIANDGAAVAVQSLDKTDLVGVITFNNQYEVLIPLAPNSDPEASARDIRAIRADGGTNLPPALEAAREQLRGVRADVKHIIVLSDGRSQNTEQLPALARAVRDDGIRISTIAVGNEADVKTMAGIATEADGAYYRVIDPNLLPRIFLKAVRVVRTPLIREVPFDPVLLASGSPVTDGLSTPPPLNGLVLTRPRDEPTVTYAMAAPSGEPVVAHWNAGLGRVGAFTSDAHHWAEPWLTSQWPGYSRLWTQLVRTIARPQPDRGQELTVELDGDDVVIRLTARDSAGKPLDNLTIEGSLHGSGGAARPGSRGRQPLRLAQVGPGEYLARVNAPGAGTSVVTLTPRADGRALPPVVGGIARSAGAEYRRLSTNVGALERLAAQTGGRVLLLDRPEEARLFDRAGLAPAMARKPLWPWLIVAGLGLFILDAASRRVAWDRFLSREYGVARRVRAARQQAARAAATVDRLKQRDEAFSAAEPSTPGPAKLSVEDAQAIVRAQAERRKQARAAARQKASEPAPGGAVEKDASRARGPAEPPSAAEGPGDARSNLLEAKRRARRQIDEDQGSG